MSVQINPLQRHPQAAQLPLEKLASNPQLSEAEKVAEVSTQFEAVLLRQIFSEAQKPVFKSKYASQSVASGIYRDLITDQLADKVSRSGSFGVAKALTQELQRQVSASAQPIEHSAIETRAPRRPSVHAPRLEVQGLRQYGGRGAI